MTPPAAVPRFSVVIPAWNEEKYLPRLLDTIDAARARFDGPLEIIVADNASSDSTAEIATARGCRVTTVEKRAIGAARNGGAAIARGEILCFTDADNRVHPDTFAVIDRTMSTGRYVAGSTGVRLERLSVGLIATWLVMVPPAILLRMDTGVVFCRREDFDAIGGYSEVRLFAEDVQFLLDLRRLGRSRGQKLVRVKGAKTIASTRKFDKHGDWHYFTQLFRLGWTMFRKPAAITDWARRYWYEDDR